MATYQNLQQIEAVVRGFESLTIPKEQFTHREHLTLAMWYVSLFDEKQALNKMRDGLRRFLDHHQVDPNKYNETITAFWMRIVRNFALSFDSDFILIDATNSLLERFNNSRLIFEYYSEGLLQSPAARSRWVEPDLKTLDC